MNPAEKALVELRRPAAKRTIGGHGDFEGFLLLLLYAPGDADLFEVELPQQRVCSTCRFLTPEFNERMPCWTCVEDENLPKWRPKS
jgi:hypothetical protein